MERACRACGAVRTGAERFCPVDGSPLLSSTVIARWRDDPLVGTLLAGKYAIVDRLGRGGLGVVYRAEQHPVGREVAVKVIAPRGGAAAQHIQRFRREARAVARLDHPNVVRLYDYGISEGGQLYMVMELVPGEELRRWIAAGPTPIARAAPIVRQLLDGLEHAHARGLVHRDIKPENLMVVTGPEGAGNLKILDFGIAKISRADDEDLVQSFATADGSVVGTPAYLSPELCRARPAGPASDVYQAGLVLYELLAGAPPFSGSSLFDMMAAHCGAEVPPLDPSLSVPPPVEAVVRRALAKEPSERHASAATMAAALEAAVSAPVSEPVPALAASNTPPLAPAPGEVESTGETADLPPRGARPARLVAAAAVLTLAGAASLYLFQTGEASSEAALQRPGLSTETAAVEPAPAPVAMAQQPAPDAALADDGTLDAAPPDAAPPDAAPPATRPLAAAPRPARRPDPPRATAAVAPPIACGDQLQALRRASEGQELRHGSPLCARIEALAREVRTGRCVMPDTDKAMVKTLTDYCRRAG